jgi:hypothetical protein
MKIVKKGIMIWGFVFILAFSLMAQNHYILEFDGVNDYVRYANDSYLQMLDGATDYTIECWIYPTTFQTYDRVLQRYYSFNISIWHVSTDGDSADWYFTLYDDGGNAHFFNAKKSLALNQWNHIAVICNSTEDWVKLFVNGGDSTAGTYSAMSMRSSVSYDNLYVGQKGNGTSFFEGYIDEVRIKNVAVDPADLHYHKTDLPYTADANTAILFHFDEGTGGTTQNSASVSPADTARLGHDGPGDTAEPVWRPWNYNGSDLSLPVELTSFAVLPGDNQAILQWTTQSEVENMGFEVYRASEENGNYLIIASYENTPSLKGSGNTNTARQYSFTDRNVLNGQIYWYKLAAVGMNGQRHFFGPLSVIPNKSGTNLTQLENIPETFALHQNFPNPFNPSTTIHFDIPRNRTGATMVTLTIYDVMGHKVRTLVKDALPAGSYKVVWDGTNDNGERVASGIYLYNMHTDKFSSTHKMMLVR